MESCLTTADRQDQINVEDLKRDLSSEFSILQNSCCREEGEHLQVYLRIRPFTSAESSNGESQDCVTMEPPDTVLLKPPTLSLPGTSDRAFPQTGQRFQFSQVYGPETSQRELFEGTVKDLVKDVLEGGNSLVFTYGVTNAGKTFTFLGPDADAGILPRALAVIFSSADGQVLPGMSVKPHRCREFTRLTPEQQDKEALFKRSLLRQLKESDKSSSSFSTNKSLHEGSSLLRTSAASDDAVSLQLEANTKLSIWVSFCEIYNDNIHDLLEAPPSGAARRAALRLSQDVKGNTFVKDLRWVQVNSAEEAYRVMKLGRRNQSFSSTRLNHVSSRSHSIFSIRILKVEDVGTPRVHAVSELCLCDLAGSERCAKTQNKGERLKEAGNINTSLLILGKCITALRHNQQAKLLQHVPFRESKLTHYLQGFFCGRGKACMIVNVNQCASMYDETLNVLKFSAVAQKVVVLSSRPPPVAPQRSSNEISFIIDNADRRSLRGGRRSSLIGWESSLEDVQEDEDDESEEEESVMEVTLNPDSEDEAQKIVLCRKTHQRQVALLEQLQAQLKTERAEGLLTEARVREEISREFSELFSDMQRDYNERLVRERRILEERAERRLEIFKNLVGKISSAKAGPGADAVEEFLDSCSFELSSLKGSEQQDRGDAGRRSEAEDRGQLLSQISRLEGRVSELQGALQEALAAVEKERTGREEAVAALEYQTVGKEEALASLEEERRSREEAVAALGQLKQSKEEVEARLERERGDRERATAAGEEQRKEASRLTEENRRRRDESDALRKQLAELSAKLEAAERQVASEGRRAEQAASQLQAAQAHLAEHRQEIQEKTSQMDALKEALQTSSVANACAGDELREEAAELRRTLAEERAKSESRGRRAAELEEELEEERTQSRLDGQRHEEELAATKQEVEELRRKIREEEEAAELLRAELEELQEKLAALQKELLEKDARIAALQEQREQEESQAVQEARRKEAERRRELLGVAHEAIALKEAELEKRGQEIGRLKEDAEWDSETVKSLKRDLQRTQDESSDLREKLADYKKQVQQVHKEISVMREEEKLLRQKTADAEKSKKQLQSDIAVRDRTIQQLRTEQPSTAKSDQTLYQKACKDLEAQQCVMEDMRLALTEQDDTQQQMEQVLEEKLVLVQELSAELEKLKAMLMQTDRGDDRPDDVRAAEEEAARAQESLKTHAEKHQAERRKWLEEKLSLIGQAKEAEDKRNQEMRKFAEDRERHGRQQSQLESQLAEQQQTMETWRAERNALVAALEVQLQKLLSSQAEKDRLIQQLSSRTPPPQGAADGAAELQAALCEKEAEILQLKEHLKASQDDALTQADSSQTPAVQGGKPQSELGGRDKRASVSSQGSSPGCPSVLDSSEISTENGRSSRFPRPELEISFSPLQPNRMALRRQGQEEAVTVKISRSGRKRKSAEMEKSYFFRRSKRAAGLQDDVEAENRKNTRSKLTPKLTTHQEESLRPAGQQEALGGRKEGTLQKIGEFLQSSPTLLGSKAKKMMSLVSGRGDGDSASSSSSSASSLSLRGKKTKRKLYRPEISCPMEMPSHPIISREPEEKESDHQIMKRRLRSRIVK